MGVAITNLRVVYKIITCISAFTEMAILIFLEIARDKKLLQAWTLCVAGYAKDAIVGACHRTIATDKNTRLLGLLDQYGTGFFTYVSQCAESKAATVATSDYSLGSFTVAGDFMLQLIRLESLGSELQES